MDLNHREIIKTKRDYLIKSVSFDAIKDHLREFKLFNKYMWDDLKTLSDVLDLLPSRGPKAFQLFVEVLLKAGYTEEANALDSSLTEVFYEMTSNPLGHCLIINNVNFEPLESGDIALEERKGSDVDAEAMRNFFEKAQFKVTVERNLTAGKMKTRIEKFAQEDLKSVDAMILVILTHGCQIKGVDLVYGTDGKPLYKYVICNLFNDNNKILKNKPKMFFFVSCRGEGRNYGVPSIFPRESTDSAGFIPVDNESSMEALLSDMYIFHSTLPKELSIRHHEKGSYFCQVLIPILQELYCEKDLESMIKEANENLSKKVSEEYRIFTLIHTQKFKDSKKIKLCRIK